MSNKRKMKELEDNLLFRLTSTQVYCERIVRGDGERRGHACYFILRTCFFCLTL